jgi:hypothetical protein
VAKTVKSASWRHAMHATPDDDADATANSDFAGSLRDILAALPEPNSVLHTLPVDNQQITASMREICALPLAECQALYLAERVGNRIHWYGNRAAMARRG